MSQKQRPETNLQTPLPPEHMRTHNPAFSEWNHVLLFPCENCQVPTIPFSSANSSNFFKSSHSARIRFPTMLIYLSVHSERWFTRTSRDFTLPIFYCPTVHICVFFILFFPVSLDSLFLASCYYVEEKTQKPGDGKTSDKWPYLSQAFTYYTIKTVKIYYMMSLCVCMYELILV